MPPSFRIVAAVVLAATVAAVLAIGTLHAGWPSGAEAAGVASPSQDGLVAMSHILISYAGAEDAPDDVRRDRDSAHERARRIALLLRTGRGDLATMAGQYSDDPTARHNEGHLGTFVREELDPRIAAVVCSLAVGEVAGPVETPHGFHVVRRDRVARVNIHHLLVAHRDADLAPSHVDRDRQEAVHIARALRRRAVSGQADLCALASRFSDDGENRGRCGEIGWVDPCQLTAEARHAIDALAPGDVSPVVESRYGFHIFWRD